MHLFLAGLEVVIIHPTHLELAERHVPYVQPLANKPKLTSLPCVKWGVHPIPGLVEQPGAKKNKEHAPSPHAPSLLCLHLVPSQAHEIAGFSSLPRQDLPF